jgi:hypothetical protein
MARAAQLENGNQNGAGAASADQSPKFAARHYTPDELAECWQLSVDSVRRLFENEPGVLVFENPERGSARRRRTLRIPESVAERVYRRLSIRGFDRKV